MVKTEWKFKKEREELIKMVERYLDKKYAKFMAEDIVDSVLVSYIDYKKGEKKSLDSGKGDGNTIRDYPRDSSECESKINPPEKSLGADKESEDTTNKKQDRLSSGESVRKEFPVETDSHKEYSSSVRPKERTQG